ncbi:MAG TPA: MFS transporter [Terriglobales bacterium]|jgi:sugar phosphate permease|nr:MFS transporter [Terriglobales bacterium]
MLRLDRTRVPETNVALENPTSPPSKTRWLVLLLISLMYMITYMDRTGISIAAPAMAKEFGLSQTALGIVFSVFLWAYALGQIPLGSLADRLGPRLVLLIIVPCWSVMTAMTAIAGGIASLIVIRFVFGLAEAGAFPTATRAMQLWFPKAERGIVHGVTHSFSRFAVAIVPFIAVSIMVAFGWRWIFYIFGAAGLLWSVAFYLLYRNLPEEHPSVNRAELAEIRGRDPDGTIKPDDLHSHLSPPWRVIFRSANMWYIAAGYCCFYYGTYFFMTWFPTYLLEYRHLSLKSVGVLASLPLLAGMVGDIVGGTLTDRVYRKTGKLKFARRIVAAPAMLVSGACLIPAAMTHSAWTAILCLTASLFFLELVISPAWAVPMDVGGEYSGTVSGVMNMAGSLAASLSPIIFGALVQRGFWVTPFFITAGVLLTGAVVWAFLIDPERSVVEDMIGRIPNLS